MLDVKKNPVRDQTWDVQIDHFQLNCTKRTMQRACKRRTPKAGRYRMLKVKEISPKNRKLRVEYGHRHKDETIESFWQYVHFTDEAHADPGELYSKRVLREEGTRYEPENMQSMPYMKGVKLHFAASVSWHHKSPLIFYNDEHDTPPVIIKKPSKPRKSKYETEEQHHQKVVEWEASLPHDADIKPKGNSMTQVYYTDKLLSVYANLINEARVYHDRRGILQEDNDNSHGTRSRDNIVIRCKQANWLELLSHPPQSPDLNPCEGVWNMLKQRARHRQWRTVAELKKVLLDEWDKITMEDIRDRISEMPERCIKLIETGGKAIKSARW